MLATPIFFYTVSAHTKMFMDRCQSLWVKKYWIDQTPFNQWTAVRQAFLISAGATRGKKLFDGMLLTMKYFFDVLDMTLWDSLLVRGLDLAGDVLAHPEHMNTAFEKGQAFAEAVRGGN
jgi:multimeric flavodoxin WrbA